MATIAWGNYVNQIIAAVKASSSFAGVVDIFDGYEIKADNLPSVIVLGNDGIGAAQGIAGTFIANYDTIGARRMKEEGTVHCYLYASSGDTDSLGDCRNTATTLLSNFDTLLRSDPSFGRSVQYSGIHDTSISYFKTTRGDAVKITFNIQYTAIT